MGLDHKDKKPRPHSGAVEGDLPFRPFDIMRPATLTSPVIFASPHSGRLYPPEFLAQSRLEQPVLRKSEDSYVDLLFEQAPHMGVPLIRALFPRSYVDVNRSADELDPKIISGVLPRQADTKSSRVAAGLGIIPRIVADGQLIYREKISIDEAHQRIHNYYMPYHEALKGLIDEARAQFGTAVVIDCHSMPSAGGLPLRHGGPKIDFVLGDRFGISCAPSLPGLIEFILMRKGFHVVRNTPYAGGHVAQSYGRPQRGVHVVQIEINRILYLDEAKLARTEDYESLRTHMTDLIAELVDIDANALMPARVAE